MQKKTSTNGWSDSDEDHNEYRSYGFFDYDKSKLVQLDLDTTTSRFYHQEPWDSGPGYAHFQSSNSSNYRIVWLGTGTIKTNHSKAEDRKSRTIGTSSLDWYYKCASARRMEVYLNFRLINMPKYNYPFAGLEN